MEKKKLPTFKEKIENYIRAADSLTQVQIDACAWVMGGSGCGWTKEKIKDDLNQALVGL